MSFLGELKRRKVFQVAAVYAVVAWLLVQIVTSIEEPLNLPGWADTLVIVLLAVAFPVALVLGWAFDVTPHGIVRTMKDEDVSGNPHGASAEPVSNVPDTAKRPLDDSTGGPPENSIAVLPFENISPNPNDAYFAVGIHEEILNQFAKLSALKVVARTSVLQYAATAKPIPQIAKELNVESIIEGSVRYAGDRVRVTIQLIAADSGMHLWSETYDREFKDIFAIESDIAMQVAGALEAELSLEEQRRVEHRPTKSAEAYAVYLQALSLAAQSTDAAPLHALFDRAIALDPGFALVHAEKAALYADSLVNTVEGIAVEPRTRNEILKLARQHADRALAADPTCGEAYAASAAVSLFTWHWSDAIDSFNNLGRWDSGRLLFSIGRQAWLLAYSGKLDEAIALGKEKLAANRNYWAGEFVLGTIHGYARDYDVAIEHLKKGASLAPAIPIMHSWMAVLLVAQRKDEAASEQVRIAEELLGKHRTLVYLPELAMTYYRLGEHDDVRRLAAEIETLAANVDIGDGTWAMVYLALDDQPKSLDHLERLAAKAQQHEIDQGFFNAMNLKMNIWADPRLEQPIFKEVFSRIAG